jgi:hypothetical protein
MPAFVLIFDIFFKVVKIGSTKLCWFSMANVLLLVRYLL